MSNKLLLLAISGLAVFTAYIWAYQEEENLDRLFEKPRSEILQTASVFYLGHSLVGKDVPAMVTQLAGDGASYNVQLGWGSPLRHHWNAPEEPVRGHETENAHSKYREAHDALASGEYDVFILTESVEIKDAIKYNDSWKYLHRWSDAARSANPKVQVFLYETWHDLDDPEGWMHRVERDLDLYWLGEIADPAMQHAGSEFPIYLIPAGQVISNFVSQVEDLGGLEDVSGLNDLFIDEIHLNHLGYYLVALTFYAVIYAKNPSGLPYQLLLADGSAAQAPKEGTAALMKEVVWDVVTQNARTGVKKK